MSRKFVFITFPIILVVVCYFLGPSPDRPKFDATLPTVPQDPVALEKYIAAGEARHKVKPDNEARIVWADSTKKNKTKFSVIYLHGFYASQGEGDPVHRDFAKKFGCNLYLARLADHGIDTVETLVQMTGDRLWSSAKEALEIGKAIGDSVIIMSTSTGGTLGLMLAAEYPSEVFALINMSPNIALAHPLAFLANNPWGLQISHLVIGGHYYIAEPKKGLDPELKRRYWYTKFRLEAVGQLQELVEDKMTRSTFEKVKQPALNLYYYKNESERDSSVSIPAIIKMNQELGTPADRKVLIAMPDVGEHVMGSRVTSHDLPGVEKAMDQFAIEKLGLRTSPHP